MSRRHSTPYTLRVTPAGQIRRYHVTDSDSEGRVRVHRNVPGRTTMRQAAIAESIG